MPYEILKDGATIPYLVRVEKNPETKKNVSVLEAEVYSQGDIVDDDKVAPDLIARYEKGDEHLCSLIKKVTDNAGS